MEKISLNGVFSEEYILERVMNLKKNGLPKGYTIGLDSVDDIFRLDTGMVAVWTGIPGSGKSEFVDFTCIRLNRKYGIKTAYYSPENSPIEMHIEKLVSKLTNRNFDDLTDEETIANTTYINENFYFMNFNKVSTLDDILKQAEELVLEKDVKVVVIDPYNKIDHQYDKHLTETQYISKVMDRLQLFAKKYNVLVNLVVHPRTQQTTDVNNLNMYSINGSANFANKSDYIIVVHRNKHVNGDTVTVKCDKVKFKNYGSAGETEVKYDYQSGNYFDFFEDTNKTDTTKTREEEMYTTAMEVLKQIDNKDKQKNVLDISVSYFTNVFDKVSKEINLYDYLMDKDKQYYNKYSGIVDCIRMCKTDEERKQVKKDSNLPCITTSCVCGNDKSDIKAINKIICIDIDKQDNLTIIDRVPSIVKRLNCVAYLAKSVSATGYYCLIPIKHTDLFKQHFNALQRDFADMGITIDKSCSNANRLRYYSYDKDAYINTNAEVYTSLMEDKREHKEQSTTNIDNDIDKVEMLESDKKQIFDMIKYLTAHKIDITKDYDDWLRIGAGIANAFGDKGYILFDRISSISPKYSSYECEAKYDSLLNNPLSDIGLGTVFHIYSKYRKAYEENNRTSTL